MDNKHIGAVLILICFSLGGVIYAFNSVLQEQTDEACSCTDSGELNFCPHEGKTPWQTYLGIIFISGLGALAVYLIFFDKTQKEIIGELNNQKNNVTKSEKFRILLMGLSKEEQKIVKAVREQEGITQQTLRLRADMHKSKLSIVLSQLEDKNLIKKVRNGKTHKIYTKFTI